MDLQDQVLNLLIVLEILVVLYFLMKPKEYEFSTKTHKMEKLRKDKELTEVKRTALRQLNDLLDKKGKLQKYESDAKRRYMKGELTYEAMQIIVDDCERKLVDLQIKMEGFEGMY